MRTLLYIQREKGHTKTAKSKQDTGYKQAIIHFWMNDRDDDGNDIVCAMTSHNPKLNIGHKREQRRIIMCGYFNVAAILNGCTNKAN